MVTLRAPEGLKVARLPSCILTPNGYMDHPSWHAMPGAVPQLGVTKIKWFLKGQTCDKQYVVESDAGESTRWQLPTLHYLRRTRGSSATRRLLFHWSGLYPLDRTTKNTNQQVSAKRHNP